MTQTQRCRYCGDFYRTDDGWGSDICWQCHSEFNIEERSRDLSWQTFYEPFDEEAHL